MSRRLRPDEIEDLVVRAQAGDEDCFSQIFDYLYEKIFRYISFKVDGEEVEDLVSEVFLRVVSQLEKYKLPEKQKSGFSAWVFRIAHNIVIDFYRKKKNDVSFDDPETGEDRFHIPDTEPLPDESVQKQFESQKIREILAKLSPANREVLELRYLEEFSNTEIAHITGKTEGNIRIMQMRALREMRKHFGNDDIEN